jgi:hypothetical protein
VEEGLGLLHDNRLKGLKTDKKTLKWQSLKEDMIDIYLITNGTDMVNMNLFIKS